MPGFAVPAFYCCGFWWTVLVYFVPANFVLGHSNSFYANSFYIFKLPSFFNSLLSVFYLLQFLWLPLAPYMGFGVRLAGRY